MALLLWARVVFLAVLAALVAASVWIGRRTNEE
jgi:hypothetical protein